MSSPIHQSDDLDPALRYAPRWARDRTALAGRPLMPPLARTARRVRADFSGDRAMVELQRQLMLDPDAIPEPIVDDARTLKPIVLRFSGVMGLAALIAWGIVSLPGLKKAGEIAPAEVKAPAMTGKPVKLVEVQPTEAAPQVSRGPVPISDPAPSSAAQQSAMTASITPTPAVAASQPAPVLPQPAPVPAEPAAGASASQIPSAATIDANPPHVDDAEITAMIKRGKSLLMSGDIASARLLLRRAADAGNAEAALALGATFDPLVIRRLGAIGMTPDIVQARQWYQRAADLGSAPARSQLAALQQTR